ncbi:MAG: hypothetical protein FWD73_00335 [Polyangiaceae bacterium]|nr:hypothetical protein [Polyangiaceae bacterium]
MIDESRGIRVALAGIAALTATSALYSALRMGQALVFREPDPALVLYSAHAGYFWRAWTAAYLGIMVGFGAWVDSRANTARQARWLAKAIPAAATLAFAQSLAWP